MKLTKATFLLAAAAAVLFQAEAIRADPVDLPTREELLARAQVIVLPTWKQYYWTPGSFETADQTFDMTCSKLYGSGLDTPDNVQASKYPVIIGPYGSPSSTHFPQRPAVIGGIVTGNQSRSLDWDDVKRDHDGNGMSITGGGWYLLDGARIDNVEDAVSPKRFPDPDGGAVGTFCARDVHATYIRDDAIENDSYAPMFIKDSLFDGAFMGISQRGAANEQGGQAHPNVVTLDGVLLRLEPMPYTVDMGGSHPVLEEFSSPDGLGHGQLFKLKGGGEDATFVMKDCVFLVERLSINGPNSMDFPPNTTAENVTLVWLNSTGYTPEAYPGDLPDHGVTVTNDRAVWDAAVKAWFLSHP